MPHFVSRILSIGLVSICLAGEVGLTNGQTTIVDDFNNCNDDGWTRGPSFPGEPTWDASVMHGGSCAYRLAILPPSPSGILASWDASLDAGFTDGFFRATVRPETQESAIIMAMRAVPGGDGYLGELYLHRGIMRIRNHGVGGTLFETELDIHANEDWFMQIGTVGDQFSLKAWRVGDSEPPSPQLTAIYSTRTTGLFAIGTGVPPGAPAGTGGTVFDDIFFFAREPFLPDFNNDLDVDVLDIDALVREIVAGMNGELFDLTGEGIVDGRDLTRWLSEAAMHNGFREDYLAGDSNLDGSVNATDLNNLALNWRQNVSEWSGGDFTAEGIVNSADLNALALNWRKSIPIATFATALIPEPSALLLTLVGLALVWRRPRCS